MNTEIITLQECANDGATIHLHFNDDLGYWMAYGYSAFGLNLFCQKYKKVLLGGFSNSLQMPFEILHKDALELLMRSAKSVEKSSELYVCVKMSEAVTHEAYCRFVKNLKDEHLMMPVVNKNGGIVADLKKDGFIADGMSSFARNFKRIQDLFVSFICLIVFSPLFLLTWILIKLDDGGPAIFKQERIGRFGRPFTIYKFRSMRLDAEKMGPQLSSHAGENDPRLTKVGAFIRAHHLDELPQLWNVFLGDMAFVGPRPEREFYINQILEFDKRYTYLYQIRPGVTSYATLYNGYTDTIEKMLKRLEYDLYYLGNRSWWFDIKILFNTFCAIVFGKKF